MGIYEIIGVVIAALGLRYLIDVPRDVRQHDRKVRNRNDDLIGWIQDADSDLQAELSKITARHSREAEKPQATQFAWPKYLRVVEKQGAKDEVLKRLNDQVREATRYREELEVDEQLPHRLWRRMPWGNTLPPLTAEEEKADIISKWQQKVTAEEVESAERRWGLISEVAAKARQTPTGPFQDQS